MAITENLKKILAAVYGRDVRQAIHDGIAGCDENIKAECSNKNGWQFVTSKSDNPPNVLIIRN